MCIRDSNQGVSLAAYSYAANMESVIFCPPYVEDKIIKELLLRNAIPVVLTEYGDAALRIVEQLVNNHSYYVSTRNFPRPFANPYGLEGYKTISFEICEQLNVVPDKVFVPTGGGDSIYGVWKGFREMFQAGIVQKKPKMFACQSKLGGDSLVKSYKSKSLRAAIVNTGDSKAISIRVKQSGDHGLWAISESNGGAYSISEKEIDNALTVIGNHGLCVDPSCAVSMAGILKSKKENLLKKYHMIHDWSKVWPETRRYLIFLHERFHEDRILLHSGHLSFVTLLSMVPLVTVVFSAFSIFPVFELSLIHI